MYRFPIEPYQSRFNRPVDLPLQQISATVNVSRSLRGKKQSNRVSKAGNTPKFTTTTLSPLAPRSMPRSAITPPINDAIEQPLTSTPRRPPAPPVNVGSLPVIATNYTNDDDALFRRIMNLKCDDSAVLGTPHEQLPTVNTPLVPTPDADEPMARDQTPSHASAIKHDALRDMEQSYEQHLQQRYNELSSKLKQESEQSVSSSATRSKAVNGAANRWGDCTRAMTTCACSENGSSSAGDGGSAAARRNVEQMNMCAVHVDAGEVVRLTVHVFSHELEEFFKVMCIIVELVDTSDRCTVCTSIIPLARQHNDIVLYRIVQFMSCREHHTPTRSRTRSGMRYRLNTSIL
jgi:hypothetical protein